MDDNSVKGLVYLFLVAGGLVSAWAVVQTIIASKWKSKCKELEASLLLKNNKIKELKIDVESNEAGADKLSSSLSDLFSELEGLESDDS